MSFRWRYRTYERKHSEIAPLIRIPLKAVWMGCMPQPPQSSVKIRRVKLQLPGGYGTLDA